MNYFYPAISVLTGETDFLEQFSTINWGGRNKTKFLTDRRTQAKLYAYEGIESYSKVELEQVQPIESAESLKQFVEARSAQYGSEDTDAVERSVEFLTQKYFAPRFELPDNYTVSFTVSLENAVLLYRGDPISSIDVYSRTPSQVLQRLQQHAEIHRDKLEDIEEIFSQHEIPYTFTHPKK